MLFGFSPTAVIAEGKGEEQGKGRSMSGNPNPRESLKLIYLVIMYWQIGYWKDMEPEDSAETVRTRGNESFVMLTGLEGDTLYHLTVRAYNGAGYGPPSGEVSATTKRHRKWPEFLCEHLCRLLQATWSEAHEVHNKQSRKGVLLQCSDLNSKTSSKKFYIHSL